MSEDGVLSSVISLGCIACVDVLTGILTDLASVRHACTEHFCQCSCCRCGGDPDDADESSLPEPGEREPLLAASGQNTEPTPQQSMQVPKRS